MTETGFNGPIISMFVNGIKIISPKESEFIQCVKTELVATFFIIDMGLISFYRGLKVK